MPIWKNLIKKRLKLKDALLPKIRRLSTLIFSVSVNVPSPAKLKRPYKMKPSPALIDPEAFRKETAGMTLSDLEVMIADRTEVKDLGFQKAVYDRLMGIVEVVKASTRKALNIPPEITVGFHDSRTKGSLSVTPKVQLGRGKLQKEITLRKILSEDPEKAAASLEKLREGIEFLRKGHSPSKTHISRLSINPKSSPPCRQ